MTKKLLQFMQTEAQAILVYGGDFLIHSSVIF